MPEQINAPHPINQLCEPIFQFLIDMPRRNPCPITTYVRTFIIVNRHFNPSLIIRSLYQDYVFLKIQALKNSGESDGHHLQTKAKKVLQQHKPYLSDAIVQLETLDLEMNEFIDRNKDLCDCQILWNQAIEKFLIKRIKKSMREFGVKRNQLNDDSLRYSLEIAFTEIPRINFVDLMTNEIRQVGDEECKYLSGETEKRYRLAAENKFIHVIPYLIRRLMIYENYRRKENVVRVFNRQNPLPNYFVPDQLGKFSQLSNQEIIDVFRKKLEHPIKPEIL